MMHIDTFIRSAVGADLSALGGCDDVRINLLMSIIRPEIENRARNSFDGLQHTLHICRRLRLE